MNDMFTISDNYLSTNDSFEYLIFIITMLSLENYKDNLDLEDKLGFQDVVINKSLICPHINVILTNPEEVRKSQPPLAAAVLGINNTAAPRYPCPPGKPRFFKTWSDIDIEQRYIDSKPTCYFILGKPGVGAFSLGEAIAKKFNCIHICPRRLLLDEIEQNSPTGRCIDFNMRHNKVIKINIIMAILKKKLESPAIKHRGYVISGLPLVTVSRNNLCLFDTLFGEESVLVVQDLLYELVMTFKKKKIKRRDPLSPNVLEGEEGLGEFLEEEDEEEEEEQALDEAEEEEDKPVELPKFLLEACSDIVFSMRPYYFSKKAVLLNQINNIFGLDMVPDIIIHIFCADANITLKRSVICINSKTGTTMFHPFTPKPELVLRWPATYELSDYVSPIDNTVLDPKYHCRQPVNFKDRTVQQLCNYRFNVSAFVKIKLKDFNPRFLLKADGRCSIHEMLHNIIEQLNVSSAVRPVLIPEPLYLEEPPEDLEEFWPMVEDMNAIQSGGVKFNRYSSPWYNRCPVELKKRHTILGRPKFAVKFFKHVYLLASLSALISFCWNPRPYLQLYFLEPVCRIIVVGTKSSGKTLISECLAWIFDAPIIDFKKICKEEKVKKYEIYCNKILPELLPIIEEDRVGKWQNEEMERTTALNEWNKVALTNLKKYIPFLLEYQKQTNQMGSEEIKNVIFLNNYKNVRQKVSFLPVPMLNDLQECQTALAEGDLSQYAPENLTTAVKKPAVPVLGDSDVAKAITTHIAANELQKEVEPSPEELVNVVLKSIDVIDSEIQEQSEQETMFGKYIIDGFPSDQEFWNYLIDNNGLPDNTIALLENREIDPELGKYYMKMESAIKDYRGQYLSGTDPLIHVKRQYKRQSDVTISETLLGSDSIESVPIEDISENDEKFTEYLSSFTTSVEKFKEDWDNIKARLEENFKSFIEVEIGSKTEVEVIDEVLLNLRKSYCEPCEPIENEDFEEEDNQEEMKDLLTYNQPKFFCETNIYCPIAFYNYGLLWEGNPEFTIRCDNKTHYFCKEECMELFRKDIVKYQAYNKPYKKIPPLRICVMGGIGTGKSTTSRQVAKELGLIYIDFLDIVNNFLMPRHFKNVGIQYENSFTDIPIEEEGIVDFNPEEENENALTDIRYNEIEVRRMLFNYFERGTPIMPALLQKLLKRLWFEEPFLKTGFVIDGFPKLPNDIEDMVACFCTPDLIIELQGSIETSLRRMTPILLKSWKIQQSEARNKAMKNLLDKKNEWTNFITQKVVVKIILDDLISFTIPAEMTDLRTSTDSAIIDADPLGSLKVDEKLFNYYNELVQEYPQPVDETDWEKPAYAQERIESRLEAIYETEDENMEALKDSLFDNRIKVVSVDATKSLTRVSRVVLSKISRLRLRNVSFLEESFVISCDIAEVLLLEGFCFLSKYNRICPVYLFENPDAILNLYRVGRQQGKIFAVIHRSFLYFINGDDSVRKFRNNPLKYIDNDKILKSYHEYTLRIGIIGPPKSGKSQLAAKLAKRYGLVCITKGMSVRNALEKLHWTARSNKIRERLSEGKIIKNDDIIKAVQSGLVDHRTATNGFVLDGFPNTPSDVVELSREGLYPLIMFDISANKDKILENSQNDIHYDILKQIPPYSRPYIEYIYDKWHKNSSAVRNYINNDVQNLYLLNGNESKWLCFQEALICLNTIIPKVHYYLHNVTSTIVPADVMGISDNIFRQRMSCFKNMCPICLCKNILKHNDYPVDKKGVVEYKDHFYWICPDHMAMVMKHPERYLNAISVDIPKVPAVVHNVNLSLVYEKGICIVTYAEHLPAQIMVPGTNKYALSYEGRRYLFCSEICHRKFMSKPHMYFDIVIFKENSNFPPISLNKLPDVGYLEQIAGNLLTEACCSVNVLRPKYPGLSIELSALLYIALYLKIHNPQVNKDILPFYIKAFKIYEARSKLILDVGLRLRSMDNPFALYPKCCDNAKKSNSGTVCKPCSSRGTSFTRKSLSKNEFDFDSASRRVPVPDERFDYLCEFHKPASKVPAFLNVVDIAGLVRGAAEGQGLGNAFLSHIKACDAIFNLCRAFDDEDVIHVDGEVNPIRDLETIGEELRLKDEEQLMQNIEKLDRVVNRGNDKKLKPEYDSLMKIKSVLVDEKKHIRFGDWSAADIEVLNKYLFLTSKPALYLVNLSEKDYIRKKNKWLPKLKEWIDKNDPGAPLIPFSGVLETKLMDMEPEERKAFLKEHGLTSALDKIIVQGYKALQLEYFFTAGPDEVKAWTIQKGTKAPQAAGRIHTDFEKGFIMAEVMHFKDFKEEGTEAACKAAGKYRQQGRNYVVEDGDVIFFKFNAGAGLKDAKKK